MTPHENHRCQAAATPGFLPVLRAVASGTDKFDLRELTAPTIQRALANGLGPLLAHISRHCAMTPRPSWADEVLAADLTARLLAAERFSALGEILHAASAGKCQPILIKGAATALLYYPAPHLRTMGDVDLFVAPGRQQALEARLSELGFEQSSALPASFYEQHHHSMPFWHPRRLMWVEVHTQLFHSSSALATDARFTFDALSPELRPAAVSDQTGLVLSHELQLLYACARWAENIDAERGVYPILDAILLIKNQGRQLDWNRLCAAAENSWAATALHLMFTLLSDWGLASVPQEVLARLAQQDRHTNRMSRRVLQRLVMRYVLAGKPYGRVATSSNVGVLWSGLVRPRPAWWNVLSLPYQLMFPPGRPHRFNLVHIVRRLLSIFHSGS